MTASLEATVGVHLKSFHLPSFAAHYRELFERAKKEGWNGLEYLGELCELEATDRVRRRIDRLLKDARLPQDKTLGSLELKRFGAALAGQIQALCDGQFLETATNVIAVGSPGTGKTHALCAIGHELARKGRTVLFASAYAMVQQLLAAKRDYRLPQELRKLDRVDCLILDDIGYVQQSREEMEVLFTLLAQRYERRSVLVSTNLVFSQWDQIFKDPMTTAAAIDRLVHHSAILEFSVGSYRAAQAQERAAQKGGKAKTN